MDFERATIKALFYDYPIEAAIRAVEESQRIGGKDGFMDILPQLVRWREESFTTTEARLMDRIAEDQWLKMEDCNRNNSIPYIYRPLLLVKNIAESLLTEDIHNSYYPLVKFDNLFRWKEATLYVGEDLLTVAYVAARDAKRLPEDYPLFLWNDVLHHDSPMVNEVLDKGLSDVHAHYNATSDVFHLNWMALMNDLTKRNNLMEEIDQYQDLQFTTADTKDIIPLNRLCIAAAYLRVLFFEGFVIKREVDPLSAKRILEVLRCDFAASGCRRDLQATIDVYRQWSLHTPDGHAIDYAIRINPEIKKNIDDIHLLFQGERELMYRFMVAYYKLCPQACEWAPYFYLYLLIKARIRKEFVQINQLKGFENFQTYQDRKASCLDGDDVWSRQYGKYVVQTTLRPNKKDILEARITPKSLATIREDFSHSVFTGKKKVYSLNQKLTFVAHFIKADYSEKKHRIKQERSNREGSIRYADYRGNLKKWVDDVLCVYTAQHKYESWDKRSRLPKLVGIDAASTEMFCRPEVFGHVYRFAKRKGLSQRTFHVGEDFFDIIDGLRAIDEAILFLDLDSNSRVGHALAIGVDAKKYYADRKYRMLMPRQYLLDNCVWLLIRAAENNIYVSNSLETELLRLAKKMYLEIGYAQYDPKLLDVHTYWNSMLLRGNELNEEDRMNPLLMSDWKQTEKVIVKDVMDAENDQEAVNLYRLYQTCHNVKTKGNEIIDDRWPDGIEDVVTELQKLLLRKLAYNNIAVECNPTSNVKIGFFDRYDEHPLLTTFDPINYLMDCHRAKVIASVNTDDRGVFATSVYTELSLMALALKKQKNLESNSPHDELYDHRAIADYIDRIRENGFKQRFK